MFFLQYPITILFGNENRMGDYRWMLYRDNPDQIFKRKSFAAILSKCFDMDPGQNVNT